MSRDEVSRERFGEVRSMLQRGPGEDRGAWAATLWSMLETEHAFGPEGYAATWVPYLAGFKEYWQEPLPMRLHSLRDLEYMCEVAPFATFELWLGGYGTDKDELYAVWDSPRSAQIGAFFISSVELSDEDVRRWAATAPMPRSDTLMMGTLGLSPDGAKALAGSRVVEGLRELSWGNNPCFSDATKRLARDEATRRLEVWSFKESGLTDAAVAPLAQARAPSLRAFHASTGALGPEGAARIGRAGWVPGLEVFELGNNALGDEGALELARAWKDGGPRRLKRLSLGLNGVGPRGLRALLEGPWVHQLEDLALHHSTLGDEGARVIAECDALTGLRDLNISSNGIGFEGFRALANAPHLASLERMTTWGNMRDDRIFEVLRTSPYLKHLYGG